jgi:hypothetical protein
VPFGYWRFASFRISGNCLLVYDVTLGDGEIRLTHLHQYQRTRRTSAQLKAGFGLSRTGFGLCTGYRTRELDVDQTIGGVHRRRDRLARREQGVPGVSASALKLADAKGVGQPWVRLTPLTIAGCIAVKSHVELVRHRVAARRSV